MYTHSKVKLIMILHMILLIKIGFEENCFIIFVYSNIKDLDVINMKVNFQLGTFFF